MLASGEITSFLGWCAVINISFLLIATSIITLLRDTITGIHARLFGLRVEDGSRAYFQRLAQ